MNAVRTPSPAWPPRPTAPLASGGGCRPR